MSYQQTQSEPLPGLYHEGGAALLRFMTTTPIMQELERRFLSTQTIMWDSERSLFQMFFHHSSEYVIES